MSFALYLFLIILVGAYVLHAPLLYLAWRKSLLSKLDYVYPALPALFWLALAGVGIGPQSLANLIEILIVVGVTLLGFIIRLLVARYIPDARYVTAKVLVSVLAFTLVLRLLIPVLPE